MSGEELKQKLSLCNLSQAEIARRLGMSQQNFNSSLNVADVKTGLLERIANAIGVDMSFFYPSEDNTLTNANNQYNAGGNIVHGDNSAGGNQTINNDEYKTLIEHQRKIIDKQNERIDKLLATIDKLVK